MKNLTDQIRSDMNLIISDGGEIDDVLAALRKLGFSQIDSIKAIKDLYKIDFSESKRRIHFSKTWADSRQSNDQLHQTAEDVLGQTDDG